MKNLMNENWTVKEYGDDFALLKIDVMRPRVGRWHYELMIAVDPAGVASEGQRGCGFAEAAMLSARPVERFEYPLVEIGDVIETPYGNYRVEWYRLFAGASANYDHLTLVEVES